MTPMTTQNPIKTLNILKLNWHCSPSVFHSLFNDPSTAERHIIMIQEPATYPQSGQPMVNPDWVQYTPSIPPPLNPNSPLTAPRCRCVTYINKKIKSHFISQTNSRSSLVVALKIKPSPDVIPINIINTYLPLLCNSITQTLTPALEQALVGPTLLGMDSNLHHSTWNPPAYTHTHQAAEDLIHLAATHHLTLQSELGVPTFYATSDRLSNTTIDLLWVNEEANDLATSCTTDTTLKHSYSSNHGAIITILDLPSSYTQLTTTPPRRNWKKINEMNLVVSLDTSLKPLIASFPPNPSHEDIDAYVLRVPTVINNAS